VEPVVSWHAARRILCVRLDGMGDVLMTTPALRALRTSAAGRRMTLLTSSTGATLAPLLHDVDDVIAYDAPWVKGDRRGPAEDRTLIREIRERQFDAAVIFTVYSQSALPAAVLCYLAEIPLRLAHCRENPYELLTTWVRDPERERPLRHEVRRQLDLVAAVGARPDREALSVRIPERAFDEAAGELSRAGLSPFDGDLIVVHPGASAPSRRYRAEGFAEAARRLAAVGHRIVFTGSAGERELVERVARSVGGSASLAGHLSVEGLAALVSMASVLITNNTGPAHLAAAVGTPVVDLYALTNTQHTPWMVPARVLYHDVPCRGCLQSVCPMEHHACLELVSVESIVAAAVDLLRESRPRPPERVRADASTRGRRRAGRGAELRRVDRAAEPARFSHRGRG
jgi:lipopolysaccharide heptosyltransferase II